jgi:hypothetical protein
LVKSSNETKDPLRAVSHAQGFHFYRTIGCCIGVTSCSLEELADAIQKVCPEAVIFHFERGDFQNWIREIIGDIELSQRIDKIKMCSRQLSEEYCRKELVETINIRILQLEVAKRPSIFSEGRKTKPHTNRVYDKGVRGLEVVLESTKNN